MSQAKSERLVNLLIALLHARQPVTRAQLRASLEGYQGLSDVNFERRFERDKDELRALGITIHTIDDGDEVGYRVDRAEFELPPIEFTVEEMTALGTAAHVWQDSVAASDTDAALATLRAAGLEAEMEPRGFGPQIHTDPAFDVVRDALLARRELRFDYRDQPRRVQPWRLSQRRGRWYLLGFDLDRGEERRFKLQRMSSTPRPVGPTQAFEIPQLGREDFTGEGVAGLVAVRSAVGADLARRGLPGVWDGPVPEGFEVLRVSAGSMELLASEISSLGEDAVALAPAELVRAVVAHLTAAVEANQ